MDRSDNSSPIGRLASNGRGGRQGTMYTTPALEQITSVVKDEDTAAFLSTARQDAKRNEYETSILNYNRAIQNLVKRCNTTSVPAQLNVLLALARVQLEAGCVALQAKSLEYAESTLKDATRGYLRCSDLIDQDTVIHKEFVEAVKSWASATATRSQTASFSDRRVYVEATRRAFQLYDWALRLVDPSGSDVSTTVLGSLSSLGQLAAQLQCFDWALELFERNQSIKEMLGIETESVRKHIDRVTDKLAHHQNSREAMRAARFREETERLMLDEFRNRMDLTFIVNKTLMRLVRSIPPAPVRSSSSSTVARGGLRSRPSSGDSTIHNFFKTGNFTGLSPQQELEAFRGDVEEGKALVKSKQLEDAQDHFTVAVDLAAQSFSIPLEEYRSALGNLAYVYCMRAQTENERGSKEYRKMMMRSVPHYKKIIEMTEERMALRQSSLQEEVSVASTYLQLGVVAVSLDRHETGLYYMRKAKTIREKFRMDTAQEERHIQAVEKVVRKRDSELLAHAAQLTEARKQTIVLNERPSFQQCVAWYNNAKVLMQQRQCEEAEPLLLQALVGFETIMSADPHIRRRAEYRLTLTGLGAAYYFLGQEHSRKTTAFAVNNEQALVYYHQALQTVSADSTTDGGDDVQVASMLFHLACCYANMRRYDVASIHFAKSKDIKQRVGLTAEDVDVNLDALTQRLVSLIDEDVIRQQAHIQRSGSSGAPAQGAAPPGTSLLHLVSSSANSSTTSTPKEMSLNGSGMESPKSIGRRNRAVSFLIPSESGDIDSMENSIVDLPSSPLTRSESPKLHLTGSILVGGGGFGSSVFGSPKSSGPLGQRDDNFSPAMQALSLPDPVTAAMTTRRPLVAPPTIATPAPRLDSGSNTASAQQKHQQQQEAMNATALIAFRMAKLEEVAKDIAADLWIPATRAIAFIAQEERRDRFDLFSSLDVTWRAFCMAEYRASLMPLLFRFTTRKEDIMRHRAFAEYQKQWLVMAQQRIMGSEQIGRNRIIVDHRRVVSLPQSDNSYAMAFNQEAMARFRVLFEQRAHYFMMIEQHHRERHMIAEVVQRRQALVFPKLVDAAVVSKSVMFKGAMKLVLSQWRTWILEGETIDRFAWIQREQLMAKLIRLKRATEMVSMDEASARAQWLQREEHTRMQGLAEQFYRSRLEIEQRHAARVMLRYPMLQGELVARETLARRETLQKPEALLFLNGILQPTLEMHQRHLRQVLERECVRVTTHSCALPVVMLNERNARSKSALQHLQQRHVAMHQALEKLEDTHRSDTMRNWEMHMLHNIAVRYLQEQEALQRSLTVEREFMRVYVGITSFERLKMRESMEDGEISRRRVLRMLHEEGLFLLFEQLQSNIRSTIQNEQFRAQSLIRFHQEREHLTLRETLLRRVGERLATDHLLKNVLFVMAPDALRAMFQTVSNRKLHTIEGSFRKMISGTASRSVGHLKRQGLQVLATATLMDTARLEAAEALRCVHVPFLAQVEHLSRLDHSYRHREIQHLMFLDHRRGMLTASAATETRVRRTKSLEEQITFEEITLSEAKLRLHAKESECRRALIEVWRASLQPNIAAPMQCEQFVINEQFARGTVFASERVAFLDDIRFSAHIDHQNVALRLAQQNAFYVVEAEFRSVLVAGEALRRSEGSRAASHLRARCLFELHELHQRSLVAELFMSSLSDLNVDAQDSQQMASLQALERSATEALTNLAFEELTTRLCCIAEPMERGLVLTELHHTQRTLLEHSASAHPHCADEEALERRSIVSEAYADYSVNVLHPALSSLHREALEEYAQRLSVLRDQVDDLEALQNTMMRSGLVVSLFLAEMMKRHEITANAHTQLSVLQDVAFEESREIGGRFESHLRRSIDHASQVEWLTTIEEASAARILTMEEGRSFEDLSMTSRLEFCALEAVTAVANVAAAEDVLWVEEIVHAFFAEQAAIEYGSIGAELLLTSEDHTRKELERLADVCASTSLDPFFAHMMLVAAECDARDKLLQEEGRIAILMEEEAHMTGVHLQQRALEMLELDARATLQTMELGEVEALGRWWSEDVHWPESFATNLFGSAWEVLQRCSLDALQHDRRIALTSAAWLSIHMSQGEQSIPFELLSLEEAIARASVASMEEDVAKGLVSAWDEGGSSIMILQREHTARLQLEHNQYAMMVMHPLEQAQLASLMLTASVEQNVAASEAAGRLALHEMILVGELTARGREYESLLAERATLFDEQRRSLMHVLTLEASERSVATQWHHNCMHQHVAAIVMAESHQRVAQVVSWEFEEQCRQYNVSVLQELQSTFLDLLVSALEPASRNCIGGDHMDAEIAQRSHILMVAVEEQEAIARSEESSTLLGAHHLQLTELAWRASIFEDYYDDMFHIQFGPILTEVTVGRLGVECAMLDERSGIEKNIYFDNFYAVQRLVVMVEFTTRLETIQRIQWIVLQEKKSCQRIVAQFRLEYEALQESLHSSPGARRHASTLGSNDGFGRHGSSEGAHIGEATMRRRGNNSNGAPTPFGPRTPGVGGFGARGLPKLPPLKAPGQESSGCATTPPVTPTALAKLSRAFTPLAELEPVKKLSRPKVMSAITTAEESIVREALNIRPSSASVLFPSASSSAAGTPRHPKPIMILSTPAAVRSNGRTVLKPLPSAMVSFKRSDVDEAAVAQFVGKVREEMDRHITMEAFQRYLVEEHYRKSIVNIMGQSLIDKFAVLGDDCMLDALDEMSTILFEGMMAGAFGLSV